MQIIDNENYIAFHRLLIIILFISGIVYFYIYSNIMASYFILLGMLMNICTISILLENKKLKDTKDQKCK